MKKLFPFDSKRAREFPSLLEPITSKQVWYINKLGDDYGVGLLADVMDSVDSSKDIEDLTKGEAMFVIKCMLGEIKPYDENYEAPDVVRDIWRDKQ